MQQISVRFCFGGQKSLRIMCTVYDVMYVNLTGIESLCLRQSYINYCFLSYFCRVLKPKSSSQDEEDEDVAKERKRVLNGGAQDDILRLENLTKVYIHVHVVHYSRLSVVCLSIQVFDRLGTNYQ